MKNFVYWLGDPGKRKQRYRIFYVLLAIVFIADFLIEHHHVTFFWDKIPGFSAVFGFVSCAVLIIVSKFIGHAWLMKKEDYYD